MFSYPILVSMASLLTSCNIYSNMFILHFDLLCVEYVCIVSYRNM